jgi:hypothetical protein
MHQKLHKYNFDFDRDAISDEGFNLPDVDEANNDLYDLHSVMGQLEHRNEKPLEQE